MFSIRGFNALKLTIIVIVLFLLQACFGSGGGGSSTPKTADISVTANPTVLHSVRLPVGSSLDAWVSIDGGSRTEMTIDNGTGIASVTITGLSRASHSVLVEYEFTYSSNTLSVTTASKNADLSAGSGLVDFIDPDFGFGFDEDEDGNTNAAELVAGTNPFGRPALSSNCFPLVVDHPYGDLYLNYDGDLLIPELDSQVVHLMNHASCAIRTMATISGQYLISVVEDKFGGRVYAGSTQSNVYSINPTDGSSSLLASVGAGFINSIVRAPAGYGSYGGQLIIATTSGQIDAINQSQASPTPVLIADLGGAVPDLVFDSAGTLYAADYYDDKVVTVAADGTVTDFATDIARPDGLEVDATGSRLLIATSLAANNTLLYEADIPGGVISPIRKMNFGVGYGTSGLALDDHDTLLMHVDSEHVTAQNISLPSINISCLPLALSDQYGNVVFRANGDLLIADTTSHDILLLNRNTCTSSTLASITGELVLSLTEDPDLNRVYAGTASGNVYTVNPDNGSSSLLTHAGFDINAMVKAPASFGDNAGQLILATGDGTIYSVDQTVASPVPQIIVDIGGPAPDLVFGSNGTLYVAVHDGGKVVTLAPDGALTTFVTGFVTPDGLAIDNAGNQLFVADSTSDTLSSVFIPSKTVTTLAHRDYSAGYYPSGLAFDGYTTVLMHTNTRQLEAIGLYQNYFGELAKLPDPVSLTLNYLLGQKITVDFRVSVKALGNWFQTAASNGQFALYSDNGGRPGNLLDYTAGFATSAGKNEIATQIEQVIEPGEYWLMGVYSSTQSSYRDSSGSVDTHYISHTFGAAPPATWPVSDSSYSEYKLNYFMTGILNP